MCIFVYILTYMILLLTDLPGAKKLLEAETRVEMLEKQIQALQKELDKEKELCDRLKSLYNPTVSISEVNANGINYLKGSFQVKMLNGKIFRSTVHIGRSDKFPNGKNDPSVLWEAQEKIKKVLKTRLIEKV